MRTVSTDLKAPPRRNAGWRNEGLSLFALAFGICYQLTRGTLAAKRTEYVRGYIAAMNDAFGDMTRDTIRKDSPS